MSKITRKRRIRRKRKDLILKRMGHCTYDSIGKCRIHGFGCK